MTMDEKRMEMLQSYKVKLEEHEKLEEKIRTSKFN